MKENFYHKRKLLKEAVNKEEFDWTAIFQKGRFLSTRKNWIRKGRVSFKKALIDTEESHSRVREGKRS